MMPLLKNVVDKKLADAASNDSLDLKLMHGNKIDMALFVHNQGLSQEEFSYMIMSGNNIGLTRSAIPKEHLCQVCQQIDFEKIFQTRVEWQDREYGKFICSLEQIDVVS